MEQSPNQTTGGHLSKTRKGQEYNSKANVQRFLTKWKQGNIKNNPSWRPQGQLKQSSSHSAYINEQGKIVQPIREIQPLQGEYSSADIIVVGGGPAGLSAALAASRVKIPNSDKSLKVMLITMGSCFGGTITQCGMQTLGWYRYGDVKQSQNCIGRQMQRISKTMGASSSFPYNDSQCLHAQKFKLVADKLVKDAGIIPLLHTHVVNVVKNEANQVAGVVTESKSGRRVIRAKRVVDATGDADLAEFANIPYRKRPTEFLMGLTLPFNCVGVKTKQFYQYIDKHPRIYRDWGSSWEQHTLDDTINQLRTPYFQQEFVKAKQNNVISKDAHPFAGSYSTVNQKTGEILNLNLMYLTNYDCTNVIDLTKAQIEARKHAMDAIKALKQTVPGFQQLQISYFGSRIGVRDSRTLESLHNLTGQYVLGYGSKCEDSVGIAPGFVDGQGILVLPTNGAYYEVPLGCLTPKSGADNILFAGRCVGADVAALMSTRNMMICTITGQGAGTAAAISCVKQKPISQYMSYIKEVQQQLIKQGVTIHGQ